MKNIVTVSGNRKHMKKCIKCNYSKRDTCFITKDGEIRNVCIACERRTGTNTHCSRCLILIGETHKTVTPIIINGKKYCNECAPKVKAP